MQVAPKADLTCLPPQLFETTIRILGGLTSAYYHSGGDELFRQKAEEFADRVLYAFNTSSGLPVGMVDLQNGARLNHGQVSLPVV
jgi:mannosyl-oligosaccharide alpha-1,2-mannosidase